MRDNWRRSWPTCSVWSRSSARSRAPPTGLERFFELPGQESIRRTSHPATPPRCSVVQVVGVVAAPSDSAPPPRDARPALPPVAPPWERIAARAAAILGLRGMMDRRASDTCSSPSSCNARKTWAFSVRLREGESAPPPPDAQARGGRPLILSGCKIPDARHSSSRHCPAAIIASTVRHQLRGHDRRQLEKALRLVREPRNSREHRVARRSLAAPAFRWPAPL